MKPKARQYQHSLRFWISKSSRENMRKHYSKNNTHRAVKLTFTLAVGVSRACGHGHPSPPM